MVYVFSVNWSTQFCTELHAPPPIITTLQAFDLATMWYCVDQWNAWWSESESSVEVNLVCFIWLQLATHITSEQALWPVLKVSGINQVSGIN